MTPRYLSHVIKASQVEAAVGLMVLLLPFILVFLYLATMKPKLVTDGMGNLVMSNLILYTVLFGLAAFLLIYIVLMLF